MSSVFLFLKCFSTIILYCTDFFENNISRQKTFKQDSAFWWNFSHSRHLWFFLVLVVLVFCSWSSWLMKMIPKDIQFALERSQLALAANVVMLHRVLLKVMSQKTSEKLVFPNCQGLSLSPKMDLLDVKQPPVEGLLSLNIQIWLVAPGALRQPDLLKDYVFFWNKSGDLTGQFFWWVPGCVLFEFPLFFFQFWGM